MKTFSSDLLSTTRLSNVLVATILVLHLLTLAYWPYLNHDVAQYISIGQMIVNGATPYTGIIDLNPPMIFYISSVPVIISKAMEISIPVTTLFFFFSIVLFSGSLFIRALTLEASHVISRAEKNLFWTFWIFLSLWTYKTGQFAQREQLIFLFIAGFIVLRKVRYDTKKMPPLLALTYGLFTAIALSLKPQFVLAIVFTEFIFLISSHDRREPYFVPEIITLVIFGAVYIGHFFIIPSASGFFSYWIPVVSRGYSVYDADWKKMFDTLFANPFTVVSLGILILALVLLIKKQKERQLCLFFAFTGFGLLSLLIYFAQFKGWPYQILPFHFGCLTGMAFLLREYKELFSKIKNVSLAALIIFNLAGSVTTLYHGNMTIKTPFQFPETSTTIVIKELVPSDQRVLFLSTLVPSVFPQMTYTERLGGGRFLTAFPIAFLTNNSPQGNISPGWEKDEQLFFSWLLQDISNYRPVLLLVDVSKEGQTFSYLSKRSFFHLVPDYRCIGLTDYFLIYLRQDENGGISLLTSSKISSLYQQNLITEAPNCY